MNFLQNITITDILLTIIPVLLAITIHELAHGFIAFRLGDDTAKSLGRLTFNPVKHIDPIGLIMLMIFRFGWAKPVPVNMLNFRHPRKYMAVTALAGPVSNIILAVLIMFLYGIFFTLLGGALVGGARGAVQDILVRSAQISVALAVFNMLPIPPLDGSKVLFSILPDDTYFKLMRIERFGFILLILFIQTNAFRNTIGQATSSIFSFLTEIFFFAHRLVN